MRAWGKRSKAVYATLDDRLKYYLDRALDECADISLIEGYRNEHNQNAAVANGRSTLLWPKGKHNSLPSKAVDFQPYPMPRRKEKLWASLAYIASYIISDARKDGVTIRWGGDCNQNGNLTDQNFDDLFHLEVIG